MTKIQHGQGVATRVEERFDATNLGAPFKVILKDAVTVSYDKATGEVLKYKIPDLEGLVWSVVVSRVLHPRRLLGAEVKFLRKAIGFKQKEVASKIEVSAEHLSRAEAGAVLLSPGSEKLFRIFSVKTALKLHKMKACDAKTQLEDALDRVFDLMAKLPNLVDVNRPPLELVFYRSKVETGTMDDGQWDGEPLEAKAA